MDRSKRSLAMPVESTTIAGAKGRGSPAARGLLMSAESNQRSRWSWWYLLFVIQFVVALWPPLFNKVEPTLIGIPFFYWFQLMWVLVSAVFTAIVYFVTEH
jgi:hypothetical protein